LVSCSVKNNSKIIINPTVQYILMPFELENYHEYCPMDYGQFIYGVFRNYNDHVITKLLSNDELNLLRNIHLTDSQLSWETYKLNNSKLNLTILTSLTEMQLVHIKHEE
uniref:hypothetical protein n=1 Tax=Cysteiniphilum halobium TaxID=2219059 RepID=UPI0013C2DE69